MLPVVHVISVVDVVDIDFVGPVPDGRPGLRAGINYIKPEASKLETRSPLDHHHRNIVDAEPVSTAKMGAEAVFRDTVSVVAATLVPGMMLTLPVVCALPLPDVLPHVVRRWFRTFSPHGIARHTADAQGFSELTRGIHELVDADTRPHVAGDCHATMAMGVRLRAGGRRLPGGEDYHPRGLSTGHSARRQAPMFPGTKPQLTQSLRPLIS